MAIHCRHLHFGLRGPRLVFRGARSGESRPTGVCWWSKTHDPNLVVTVKDQTVTLYDKVKDRRFVLTAGDYDVEVREDDGGVRFATKKFTILRGGRETFGGDLRKRVLTFRRPKSP